MMYKFARSDSALRVLAIAAVFIPASTSFAQVTRVRTRGDIAAQQSSKSDWMAQQSEAETVVLQIDYDQNSNDGTRMDGQTLVSLLKSTLLTDPAMTKGTGLSIDEARKAVTIDVQQAGGRFVQLSVAIHPGATVPEADPGKKIIRELCDRLKAAVAQSAKASASIAEARRGSLETDLKAAQQRLDEASAQYKYAREHQSTYNGNGNEPRYQLQNLQQQKQQLELALVGSKARLKVLMEPSPTTMPSAAPSSPAQTDSPIARLINSRTKRLEEVKSRVAKGEATSAEVVDAEAMLEDARAMAELLQQSTAGRFPRTDFNSGFSSATDLTSLRASIAENEARVASLNDQIEKLNGMLPTTQSDNGVPAEQVNRLLNEQQRRQNDVDGIQSQLTDYRRIRGRGAAPVLTVLDGNTAPAAASPTTEP